MDTGKGARAEGACSTTTITTSSSAPWRDLIQISWRDGSRKKGDREIGRVGSEMTNCLEELGKSLSCSGIHVLTTKIHLTFND